MLCRRSSGSDETLAVVDWPDADSVAVCMAHFMFRRHASGSPQSQQPLFPGLMLTNTL